MVYIQNAQFQGKLEERKRQDAVLKENLILRRKQVLEQEKQWSKIQCKGYRDHITESKFLKNNQIRVEKSVQKCAEEEKLTKKYQLALIATGEAHRNATESMRVQSNSVMLNKELALLRHHQESLRANHATKLHRIEMIKHRQHDKEIQKLKKVKEDFKQSEREDAHAAGETYSVKQKIEESRRAWIAYHSKGPSVRRQTSVQQSALSVEHRRVVPVDAKVFRHGMGPRDRSIVLNDAVAEEVVVQERTWDRVMRELLSNNRVLRRARSAQAKVTQANNVQFLDDELKLLEAADRSGVRTQRVRNGARISNPDTENSRLRDGFEETFMSRHIDTRYAAPVNPVDRDDLRRSPEVGSGQWAASGRELSSVNSRTGSSCFTQTSHLAQPAIAQWVPAIHPDVKPWHAVRSMSQSHPVIRPHSERPPDESIDALFPPTVENYFDDSSSSSGSVRNAFSETSLDNSLVRPAVGIDLEGLLSQPRAVQPPPSFIQVDFTPPGSARRAAEDHGAGVPDASWTNVSGDAPLSRSQRSHNVRGNRFAEAGSVESRRSAPSTDDSVSTDRARHDTRHSPLVPLMAGSSVSSDLSGASLRESSGSLDSLEAPAVRVAQTHDVVFAGNAGWESEFRCSSMESDSFLAQASRTSEGLLETHGVFLERFGVDISASTNSSSGSSGSSDQASLYVEYQQLVDAALSPARSVRSSTTSSSSGSESVRTASTAASGLLQWSGSRNSSMSSSGMPVISSVKVVSSHERSHTSSSSSSRSSRSNSNSNGSHSVEPHLYQTPSVAVPSVGVLDSVRSSLDGGDQLSVASGDTDTLFRQWDELYRSSQAIAQSRASSASKSTPSSTDTRLNLNRREEQDSSSSLGDDHSYLGRHSAVTVSAREPSGSTVIAASQAEGRAEALLRELDALSAQWNSRQFSSHQTVDLRGPSVSSSSSLSMDASVSARGGDSPLLYSISQMQRDASFSSHSQSLDRSVLFPPMPSDRHPSMRNNVRISGDSLSTLSSPATSVVLTAIVALPPGVEPPAVRPDADSPPIYPWSLGSPRSAHSSRSVSSSSSSSRAAESQDSVLFSERDTSEAREDSVLFSTDLAQQSLTAASSSLSDGTPSDFGGDALHSLRRTAVISTPLTAYSLRSGHGHVGWSETHADHTPSTLGRSSAHYRSPYSTSGVSMVSVQSLSASPAAVTRGLETDSVSSAQWGSGTPPLLQQQQQTESDGDEEGEYEDDEEDSLLSEQSMDSLLEYRRATGSYM